MSNSFYTNVSCFGGDILYRGILNGVRTKTKIQDYSPSLYIETKDETPFKTLNGASLIRKKFDNIDNAKNFVKQFSGVSNSPKIYGNTRYEYAYIAEHTESDISWDMSRILVAVLDIEVEIGEGFPEPHLAEQPITAITMSFLGGNTYIFGCGDYTPVGEEKYTKCKDEWTLCKNFLELWTRNYPDVISGWNVLFFDIPYIVNRFNRVLGSTYSSKLSPWNFIAERSSNANNKQVNYYNIPGVSILDYMDLYKWYAPDGKSQESYKLGDVANEELGEGKLSFEEFDSLTDLYRNNYQKYVEYNVKDVQLILKMDNKLKLFELAFTIAYDTHSNYEDVFAQTRMWDSLIYSQLLRKNIIVPPTERKEKDFAFEGAYVKDPQVGLHQWIASFDLTSLYPHLMMQYNISPETLVEPEDYTDEMMKIISQGVSVEKLLRKEIDLSGLSGVTLSPNGQFFRTDTQGFFSEMINKMFKERQTAKKKMLALQQELENDPTNRKLIDSVSKYNNLQLAKKVGLNSLYGVLGSNYFRFYDLRLALAVTQSGKLSIKWIENKINQYMNKVLDTNGLDFVIASDTDSIYLNMGPLIDKLNTKDKSIKDIINLMDSICEKKIQPFIDKSYKELSEYVHAYEQKMKMKREALANKGIWTAKKRYILNVYNNEGIVYNEPHLKTMGLEVIKSSTPKVVRGKMKELIKLLMNSDETTVQEYIESFRIHFKDLPAEEVSFPRGINGIKEYSDASKIYKKGTPIHVKGALLYNHQLEILGLEKKYQKIQDGDKLKFTYLKMPNPFKDTSLSFPSRIPPEFKIGKYVDYDMQYEKTFLNPIKSILDCIGWKVEKNNSIEDFFS